MRIFSSVDCLNLWESGAGLHPLDQGLLALCAALPETSQETLADWPLGRRNAALAQLRSSSFGPRLQGCTACRQCGEKLEVEFDGRVLATAGAHLSEVSAETVLVNGRAFRLPATRDLAKAAEEADARLATVRLVESCLVESSLAQNGKPQSWSDDELEQIGQAMAAADPLAETLLALRCPVCESESEETLDIVTFLWGEIEARARRLLLDIHTLAIAYGWAEADILLLSPRRRAAYMEMAQ
jgi:hypothetical protein